MLRFLHIENIAIIRRLDIELGEGFSVLTGETGAGKSIIIDSINLLLGNRVGRELIRSGETSATVSAVFDKLSPAVCDALAEMGFPTEDGTLMLQRTLDEQGRSKSRLDGQVITQSVQREIARMLVSIHGQSDNQKLLQKATHGALLDAYAQLDAEMEAYRTLYGELKAVRRRLETLSHNEAEKLRLREMLAFQIADIDALKLREGEEEELTRERDRLSNLELINSRVETAYRALRGGEKATAQALIGRAESALRALSGIVEGVDAVAERLGAVWSEVEDIAEIVIGFADDDREDPIARIDRIEERLEGISKLKRKYGATIKDILAFRNKAAAQLDELENSDELLGKLQAEEKRLLREATKAAAILTDLRRCAAEEIKASVTETLSFLDMPRVRFEVGITEVPLGERGADDIEFLISANAGEPLMPMIKIASGGELSRIMLALRSVLGDRDGAATMIYDEVDTGISGKTSRKVGMKLRESAKNAQVLCVTHSAQIASLADAHFRISKEEQNGRVETAIKQLDATERVEEIARILGGIEITNAQRDAAREMIEEYRT